MWTVTIGSSSAGLNQAWLNQYKATVIAVADYFSRFIDDSKASIDIQVEFYNTVTPPPKLVLDWRLDHTSNGVDYLSTTVLTELKSGVDLNGSSPDILINLPYGQPGVYDGSGFSPVVGGASFGPIWQSTFDVIWHALGLDSFRLTSATTLTTFDEFLMQRGSGGFLHFDFVFPGNSHPARALEFIDSVPSGDWVHFQGANHYYQFGAHFLSIQDIDVFRELGIPIVTGPTNANDVLYTLADDVLGRNSPIDGGSGNDVIYGLFGRDEISGGDGDDSLEGYSDDDTLFGGVGADTLRGDASDDFLAGGAGADLLDGGTEYAFGDYADYSTSSGAVFITIGVSSSGGDAAGDILIDIENLIGSAFGDQLTGDFNRNLLKGGDGADILNGADGNDTLIGADSSNLFNGFRDTLVGGAGADSIIGDSEDVISYRTSSQGVHVELFVPNTPFSPHWLAEGGDAEGDILSIYNQAQNLEGSAFNDTLAGDYPFFSSKDGSEIFGLAGDDQITGFGDNDLLDGGSGDDTLSSGAGIDTLIGGAGDDLLRAGDGNDRLFAGLGDDRADGGLGDDYVVTSNGRDTLLGGAGIDTLGGGSGGDLLNGNAGADFILASNGNDRLLGGDDNDTMLGGGGRDTLTGGAGDDRLVGGSQNDRFNFTPGSGADLIVDFAAGAGPGDVIGLIGWGAAFNDFADVLAAASQVGNNVVINLGGGDSITLQGTTIASLNADDFAFG